MPAAAISSRVSVPAAALLIALVGCGGGSHTGSAAAQRSLTPTACPTVVRDTLAAIARRIYVQAASGRNVVSARRRLAHSQALSRAVSTGDARATRAALAPLLKHQIRRIVVRRGTKVLANIGSGRSLAPVNGVIRLSGRAVGRYTLTVSNDRSIAGVTHSVTGAEVLMSSGPRMIVSTLSHPPVLTTRQTSATLSGVHYTVARFAGTAFPRGQLQITMLLPASALTTCASTLAGTRAATIGAVGQRLFAAESSGAQVQRVLRHVAKDSGFRNAVAHDDARGLRRAIVRFFRDRNLHVVRIRATTTSGRLVNDVGGPYVLAPASRTVRDAAGRPLGRVTLSVQDDTGYIKLMRRFTGAAVLLRTPAGQVPGSTLAPGPADLPDRGPVSYAGVTYEAYSFAAGAFPSGPLRISLLTGG
jgi:hypothetical protein